MKERPILFSAPMVRAILDGRKTQTRRVVKPQPHDTHEIECGIYHPTVIDRHGEEDAGPPIFGAYSMDGEWGCKCPYGQPGDRLWVREAFGTCDSYVPHVFYRADGEAPNHDFKWKPSIHMPRWASRVTLEIVSVRVERLQGINRGDAMAEGCPFPNMARETDPRTWFVDLLESINGAGSWEANPWVWVIEFKRVQP